jgi:hypothetical protein
MVVLDSRSSVILLLPLSDISAPFKNSGFHLFPENTKYGGKELHMAFPPAMIVTVDDLPEVIACGFVSLLHTIFGGECSVLTLVSSTLKICPGLSCRLYFVRIVESSF